jgi:hypothetical protein
MAAKQCDGVRPRDDRARLRAAVLQLGATLGWEPHEVIAFTEALSDCSWGRCGSDEFRAALDEYLSIAKAVEARATRGAHPGAARIP